MNNKFKNADPTEGQRKAIAKIEDELGLKFVGKTRKDAYKFINKNIDNCRGVYRPHKKEQKE